MGAELGFEVEGLALVDADGNPAPNGEKASSTAIRHALAEGDLPRARAMLGRAYEVRGVVAHGDERGRELGFPTAHDSVPGVILLPSAADRRVGKEGVSTCTSRGSPSAYK